MTKNLHFESGRSMVEMLGTLAIIGVLSIGGIAGYSYGMDKYRANRTMYDVNVRAIDVLAQFDATGDASLDGWKNEKTLYPITLEDETIGIQVSDVPSRVCELMVEGMEKHAKAVKINAEYVGENAGDCGDENTLVFYFDEDEEITSVPCPTEPGFDPVSCDSEEGAMICLLGTCVPDGTVFCEPDAECPIDKGCIAIDGETVLPLIGAECQKDGKQGKCDGNGKCNTDRDDEPLVCGGVNCEEYITSFVELYEQETGEPFPYQVPPKECMQCVEDTCSVVPIDADMGLCFADGFSMCANLDENLPICMPLVQKCETDADCSKCQSCIEGVCQSGDGACTTSDGKPGMCDYEDYCYACDSEYAFEPNNSNACSTICPERQISPSGWYCGLRCGMGEAEDKPLTDFYGYCYSCDSTSVVEVFDGECSEICPNRVKVGNTCVLLCGQGIYADQPLTDIKDSWNITCQYCDTSSPVYVGKDGKCSDVCPGRILTSSGYCAKPCPSHMPLMASDGTCHTCDETSSITVGQDGQCENLCSNRVKDGYYCRLKCGEGDLQDKPLVDRNGNCHSCDEEKGISVASASQCEDICSNRVYNSNSYSYGCHLKCGEGDYADKPLLDYYGKCHSCDTTERVDVDNSSGPDHPCVEVCSNRIKADSKCVPGCTSDAPLASITGYCYSCDQNGDVKVGTNGQCSEVCSERVKEGEYCRLKCGEGDLKDKPLQSDNGTCYSCDENKEVYVGINGQCSEVCSGRVKDGAYCSLKCGEGMYADKPLQDNSGACHSCSEGDGVYVGGGQCSEVCQNLEKDGSYCRLKCGVGEYADKPLRDIKGVCHSCTEGKGIEVGVDGQCTEVCPNLEKQGQYCSVFSCNTSEKPLLSIGGTCFPCNQSNAIVIADDGKCTEVCPNRVKAPDGDQGVYCVKACSSSSPLMNKNGSCYSCSYNGDVNVGEHGQCSEVCPERIKEGTQCRLKCGEGDLKDKPLMTTVGACYSCDYNYGLSVPTGDCNKICPNRIERDGECRLPCGTGDYADKPLLDYYGKCHACDTTEGIYIYNSGGSSDYPCVELCPNRVKDGHYCELPS